MPEPLNAADRELMARPLDTLTEAELHRRIFLSVYMSKRGATSWLGRYRWRRAWLRARRALNARNVSRLGDVSAPCERCGRRRSTVHTMYGHDHDRRVTHLCEPCSKHEPPGHFVMFEIPDRST